MALLLETSMHVCILLWVAASSLTMVIASSTGWADQWSVVRQLQGPYWVEAEGLERSDVTEGLTGIYGLPLELTMQLMAPVPPPTHRRVRNIIHSRANHDDDAMIPSLCKPIDSNNCVSNAELLASDNDDDGMINVHPHDDMSNNDGMIPPHDDKFGHDDGMIPPSCATPPPLPLPLRPLMNAQVDIWHCSFNGLYSGTASDSSTLGLRWLRGYQKTDAHGRVTFHTIYPGWYPDRTVHIHVRVRLFHNLSAAPASGAGPFEIRRLVVYDDTTQLYFHDALSDDIYAHVYPYNTRGRERLTRNRDDWHFNPSNLIRNITGCHSACAHYQNDSTTSCAGYKAYVVLRLPFGLPLLPPPPYA